MKPTKAFPVVVLLAVFAGCAMQNVDSGIGDEDVLGLLGDDDAGDSKLDAATTEMDSGTTNPGDDAGTTNTPDTGATDGRVSGSDANADRPATDTGVTRVDVGVDTGTVSGRDVPVSQDAGFPTDTGTTSVDPCAAASACGGCTAMSSCGWCATTNLCQTGSPTGPTGSSCAMWAWTSSMCTSTTPDPCSFNDVCADCASESSCGWCSDDSTCHSGNSHGPTTGTCRNWHWNTFLGLFCL